MVNFKNTISDPEVVMSGVSQGSISGPLLFIFFMNDMPSEIKEGRVAMYADDSTVSVSGKTIKEIEKSWTYVLVKSLRNEVKRRWLLMQRKQSLCWSRHSKNARSWKETNKIKRLKWRWMNSHYFRFTNKSQLELVSTDILHGRIKLKAYAIL